VCACARAHVRVRACVSRFMCNGLIIYRLYVEPHVN